MNYIYNEPIYPSTIQWSTFCCRCRLARAAGDFFRWAMHKPSKKSFLGVHMHPNLDGSTWLGQGGALKVFWKGFGSAMMLGGFFFDLIFQIFLAKTAKNWKKFGWNWFMLFRSISLQGTRTTWKNSTSWAHLPGHFSISIRFLFQLTEWSFSSGA